MVEPRSAAVEKAEKSSPKDAEVSIARDFQPGSRRTGVERAGVILGTFFGAGYFPLGSGTLASAVMVALFVLLWPAEVSPLWLLAGAAALFAPAVWAAGACERQFGARDPGRVVVDEVLGQMIAFAALPRGQSAASDWKYWLLGFILFRFFDIVKPFPIRRSERLPGGWGVVADDCLAGAYAFAAVWAAVWLGV